MYKVICIFDFKTYCSLFSSQRNSVPIFILLSCSTRSTTAYGRGNAALNHSGNLRPTRMCSTNTNTRPRPWSLASSAQIIPKLHLLASVSVLTWTIVLSWAEIILSFFSVGHWGGIPVTDTAWSPPHKIHMYPILNQVFDHYRVLL